MRITSPRPQSVQPTTTLQALVNLKRPTLKLSPLTHNNTDDPSADHPELHALEFEYDCDAPKCAISVSIIHAPDSTDKPSDSTNAHGSRTVVYEAVFDGGFGRTLKHEDGASLELSHFEDGKPKPHRPSVSAVDSKAGSGSPNDSKDNLDFAPPATIPELRAPGSNSSASDVNASTAAGNGSGNVNGTEGAQHGKEKKRRFTALTHFRKRNNHSHHHNTSISGPALAVMDAEAGTASGDQDQTQVGASPSAGGAKEGKDGKKEDEGVKVVIRLAACDEEGKEFEGGERNEQGTYLHVVRFGPKPPVVEGEEDGRPWVVKVVKREATVSSLSPLSPFLHVMIDRKVLIVGYTTDWPSHLPSP